MGVVASYIGICSGLSVAGVQQMSLETGKHPSSLLYCEGFYLGISVSDYFLQNPNINVILLLSVDFDNHNVFVMWFMHLCACVCACARARTYIWRAVLTTVTFFSEAHIGKSFVLKSSLLGFFSLLPTLEPEP